mmetsp:Transcript_3632/g.13040  ORF Transcript_3632/g.13040 Transcript_3632/m.13040 type:complete len:444 (+) Transcript_3632:85-1416(+)|eukprot:scaffold1146_cov399-Prasinococcus_capsulatus_cf.AAC.91
MNFLRVSARSARRAYQGLLLQRMASSAALPLREVAAFRAQNAFCIANVQREALHGALRQSPSKHVYQFVRCLSTETPVSVEVPQMGDSISEGEVAAVLKAVGDTVGADEVVAQIETDKVTIDVRAPQSGTISEVLVGEGDTVTVGHKVATLIPGEVEAKPVEEATPSAPPPSEAAAAPPPPPVAEASPAKPPATPAPPRQSVPAPPVDNAEPLEVRVPMTRLRKRVAERLKDSQNTMAMLTTFNEIDMSKLMAMRSEYKDEFMETHSSKLGFMSAFIKAATVALKANPAVNAVIEGDDVIYRNYYDISVAVSSPKGLVVPVLRGVDKKSFAEIENEIVALGKKAKEGTIGLDDMVGGTFTISNGGVFGSLLSTPIINPPQSAILGMHSIQKRPVVVDDQIVIRPMMYVALTYDHRLIDGRESVSFLKKIKAVVEDPRRLVLDL